MFVGWRLQLVQVLLFVIKNMIFMGAETYYM